MKVKEIMTPEVECARPTSTLHEAADRMKVLDVGSLPVCDQDQLVGMVTDRDIVIRSVAAGHDPETDTVNDVMTREIVYCFEDQDVSESAEIMKSHQIRRLPVLNRDKRLVGILSLGDVVNETHGQHLAEEALEGISEPARF